MQNISFIIPNYNGRNLLAKNLPFLFKAKENYKAEIEIIVVDDGSSDDSVNFLRKNYPSIKIINLEKNIGFSKAINIAVKEAKYKIIYLLNNDVEVYEDFITSLTKHFDDSQIFAVSSLEIKKEGVLIPHPRIIFGMFLHYYRYFFSDEALEVFLASGGNSAFDKEKFLALGGFDEIFSPFYWEDIDLCYRAYRKGWKCLLEPKSKVIHKGQETISKVYSNNQINCIYWKNYFLFLFKNFPCTFLLKSIFFLPISLLIASHIRPLVLAGFFKALRSISFIIKKRKILSKEKFLYNHKEIINYFRYVSFSKKGILYINDTGNIIGGGEISLYELIEKFCNLNFRLYLLTKEEGDFTKKISKLNIPIFTFPLKKLKNPLNFFSGISYMFFLSNLIDKYSIDVIHSNSTGSLTLLSAFVAYFKRIPFIWHVRSVDSAGFFDFFQSCLSTKIIVISKAVKKRFWWLPIQDKIALVYNGITIEKFNPSLNKNFKALLKCSESDFLVGTIGRFVKWKGYEYLIKAAGLVLEKIPNVKFLIVGLDYDDKNYYLKFLKKLARKLNVEKNIIFFRRIDDIVSVYNFLDIFVFTSLKEPFGRVIIEAMASYRAIVAFKKYAVSEIIEDGVSGLLVPSKNYKVLASKIIYLLEHKDKRDNLGVNARRRAEENFTITTCVKKINEVYEEVLNINSLKNKCNLCNENKYMIFKKNDSKIVKCIRCGLIYVMPQPDKEEIYKHYNKDYYLPWIIKQNLSRKYICKRRLTKVELFKKGKRLLDVGCGLGDFLNEAKGNSWDVYGTEVSEYAIKYAKDTYAVEVFMGELVDIEFEDNFFDVITFWHVLEHLKDPFSYLVKARRILKPDGIIVIAVPNVRNYIYRFAYRIFKMRSSKDFSVENRELHLYHFSEDTLKRMLIKAGFSVIRFGIDTERILFVEKILDKIALIIYKFFKKNFGIALEVYAKKI